MTTTERRQNPPSLDEAKFSTQRLVTYALLLIFTAVVANVLLNNDQAERSTIIQTVINFMTFVVGFWIGASKAANDANQAIGDIAKAAAPATAAAVAANVAAAAAAATPGVAIPLVPVEVPPAPPTTGAPQ